MDRKVQKRAWKLLNAQLDGNLDRNTARGIRAWFIGKAHEEEKFIALEDHWNKRITENHNPGAEVNADFAKIADRLGFPQREYAKPQFAKPTAKTPARRRIILRAAAIVLPFFLIASTAYIWVGQLSGNMEHPPIAEVIVTASDTNGGAVELADGSTIRVESGYVGHARDFGKERYVEMEGEAYFNVAKDTAHVFTVHTDHFNIRVLGTEFKINTSATEDTATVHLFHGSISVETGQRSFVMTPGQMLLYRRSTGESVLSQIAVDDLTYDRMPDLVFDGGSLQEAFAIIEQKYGVPVIVEGTLQTDDGILKADLSHAQSINSVMNILSTATGRFTYKIADGKIIVYGN